MDAEGYKKTIEELIKLIDAGVYVVDQDGIGMFYTGPWRIWSRST